MILGFLGVAFGVICFIAFLFKVIYEAGSNKKLTSGEYWLVVFILITLLCIILGAICS